MQFNKAALGLVLCTVMVPKPARSQYEQNLNMGKHCHEAEDLVIVSVKTADYL